MLEPAHLKKCKTEYQNRCVWKSASGQRKEDNTCRYVKDILIGEGKIPDDVDHGDVEHF